MAQGSTRDQQITKIVQQKNQFINEAINDILFERSWFQISSNQKFCNAKVDKYNEDEKEYIRCMRQRMQLDEKNLQQFVKSMNKLESDYYNCIEESARRKITLNFAVKTCQKAFFLRFNKLKKKYQPPRH